MFRVLASFILLTASFAVFGQGFTRRAPVEYVVRIQEERRSTRWTLTEWLRIKERMKMMDVWLAMFSSQEDKAKGFQPEISFQYEKMFLYNKDSLLESELSTQYQLKLWLTNIFTATTGLRFLNIDLGFEGGVTQFAGGTPSSFFPEKRIHYGGMLRLLGDNTQDTSLTFHIGKFELDEPSASRFHDWYWGGYLQLYFWHWLGVSGEYRDFGTNTLVGAGGPQYEHTVWKSKLFLEVGFLRLLGGYGAIDLPEAHRKLLFVEAHLNF